MEFESDEDFEVWKNQVQHDESIEFTCITSNFQGRIKNFQCHRSGKYICTRGTRQGKKERAPPKRRAPSVKLGFDCSAFIYYKLQNDGKVLVTACMDHYGHDFDGRFLKVTAQQKESVKAVLKQNTNITAVEVLQKLENDDSKRPLTAQDVRNIAHQMGIRLVPLPSGPPHRSSKPGKRRVFQDKDRERVGASLQEIYTGVMQDIGDATLLSLIDEKVNEICTIIRETRYAPFERDEEEEWLSEAETGIPDKGGFAVIDEADLQVVEQNQAEPKLDPNPNTFVIVYESEAQHRHSVASQQEQQQCQQSSDSLGRNVSAFGRRLAHCPSFVDANEPPGRSCNSSQRQAREYRRSLVERRKYTSYKSASHIMAGSQDGGRKCYVVGRRRAPVSHSFDGNDT